MSIVPETRDTFNHDPDKVADYHAYWADELQRLDGIIISASSWTVPAGLTMEDSSFTMNDATIRISGGTPGQRYRLVNHIVCNDGQEFDKSIYLRCRQA